MTTKCCYSRDCPCDFATRRLIEIVGESGANGKVADMRKDLDDVIAEQSSLRKLVMKMLVVMATSSAIGAGASHALLNLL